MSGSHHRHHLGQYDGRLQVGTSNRGWVEGERFSFELRAAQGQLHLLPEFAVAKAPWTPFLAEMVNLGVNLIAVIGTVTVTAVRRATSTIPIVFAVVVEPIATDWPRTWNVPVETSLG